MNVLANAISERLKELGWQQNELAYKWHTCAGKGRVSTYETKLSKLLNGSSEGLDFIADNPDRQRALAEALGWPPDKVATLAETAKNRPTLVIDPRMPEKQRTFLLKRHALAPDTFDCIQFDDLGDGSPREALRDAAIKAPNAFVIVPDDGDHDFFEGAGIRTTHMEQEEYGYRVAALPELLPPLPPKLHDDDGMPLLPAAGHADAEGRPLGLRLDELLERWRSVPTPEQLHDIALKRALDRLRSEADDAREECIWLRGDTILVLGPSDGDHVRTIEAYHPIHQVKTFEPIAEALAKVMSSLNPNGEGGHLDISSELTAFEEETGMLLTFDIADVRKMIAPRGRNDFARGVPVQLNAERDAEVYALLDDILRRELVLPEDKAHLGLVMHKMRSAPLVHISKEVGTLSALADIGAGHIVWFNATTYGGEKPTTVRMVGRDTNGWEQTFDGGNVRFTLKISFERSLEGSMVRSVGRRREEKALD